MATINSINNRLNDPTINGGIFDTNNNEVLKITATASAVNEVTLANAATGGSPTLSATGGDTDIGISIVPKGIGAVKIGYSTITEPTYTASDVAIFINDTGENAAVQIVTPNNKVGALSFSDPEARSTGSVTYDHVNNFMAFYTNGGVERMRIDSAGNIGIGMTPIFLLDITGTGGNGIRYTQNSKSLFLGVDSVNIPSIKVTTNDPLGLYTNNIQRFSIAAAGTITAQSSINYAADAQANDTYVITLDPALTAYVTGQQIIFKANTANTGAATIDVNGLGAKTIVKRVNTTLANSDILAGMFCHLVYDGTNFVLLNPVVN